ncbi:TfoX/Sxy family transcriptional regulator of competence genes [Lutibacter sp. Hel_I_33_5]|uniref:TfoX/Sxy family protein n=1 Tax=Lutibacter sp. Hel_I_33_5 TaxID=1566289 RepID=UPI0011A438B1|nr:TfoX/Sxy family protein [Lutibacter sp. Hel_I_33_5]TVZ56950.1 TfoX/Sxy family transcriptional regulator of competence genes [Lutibacter sp. Hel_I_33_5]
MPYNQFLADRIAQYFKEKNINYFEKKMFGGVCFMVDDKMCVGVNRDEIMARINPDIYQESLLKNGCNEMNFTGRPMKGFVFLSDEAIDLDTNLHEWLQLALDFNPLAKMSKKKKPIKS